MDIIGNKIFTESKVLLDNVAMLFDKGKPVPQAADKAEVLATRYASVCRIEVSDPGAARQLREEVERQLRPDADWEDLQHQPL